MNVVFELVETHRGETHDKDWVRVKIWGDETPISLMVGDTITVKT